MSRAASRPSSATVAPTIDLSGIRRRGTNSASGNENAVEADPAGPQGGASTGVPPNAASKRCPSAAPVRPSLRRYQLVHAEELERVRPGAARLPVSRAGQVLELGDGVLVGALGGDRLAGSEWYPAAADLDALLLRADEMHLDAPVARVVDGPVLERREVEAGTELAIDARKQVEVEGGRHAGAVVVGTHQLARVLLEVDADHESAAGRQHGAEDAQEARRLDGHQVADGRAGEESRLVPPCQLSRQSNGKGEIGDDGAHGDVRKARRQPPLSGSQGAVRHIDGDVSAKARQAIEQHLRLEARAGAELDEHAAVRHAGCNLLVMSFEDRGLGARRIVLWKLGDPLEQLAAPRVIEVAAGQRLRGACQALQNLGGEGVGVSVGGGRTKTRVQHGPFLPSLLLLRARYDRGDHLGGHGEGGLAVRYLVAARDPGEIRVGRPDLAACVLLHEQAHGPVEACLSLGSDE